MTEIMNVFKLDCKFVFYSMKLLISYYACSIFVHMVYWFIMSSFHKDHTCPLALYRELATDIIACNTEETFVEDSLEIKNVEEVFLATSG